MVITRSDLENKVKCEALIEKKLDDIGLGSPDLENRTMVRAATKEYYTGLIQEHLDNTTDVVCDDLLDDLEGTVIGFFDGYRDGLKESVLEAQ